MQLHHRGLEDVQLEGSAITIGSFDGVHLGHRLIIDKLTGYARKHSLPSVVVTFFPHPVIVLRNLHEPYYLTFPDQKASILFDLGIERVITIPFTRELSDYSPYQFMDWLNNHIHIRYMFVGKDFALGKDRRGDPDTLKEIGRSMGYGLETISPVEEDHERISSSRIRNVLRAGDVETGTALLGRNYSIPVSIASTEKSENSTDAPSLLELVCNPLQLLPAPGFYTANIGTVPALQCIVNVLPAPHRAGTNLLALPASPARLAFSEKSSSLTFHSRIRNLQTDMADPNTLQRMQEELHKLLERGGHDE
jgi:riboflavin kinase/FMN adenylyltransferase